MLFKKLSKPDRQATQLAYRVKYMPASTLSHAAQDLVRLNYTRKYRKADLLANMNESQSALVTLNREWKIVWAFNNVPTEQEWDSRSDGSFIDVELRISPAIDCQAVAILSFGFPGEKLRATARGDISVSNNLMHDFILNS